MVSQAIISEVIPESVADKAGLKPHDQVLLLNNTVLKDIIDYQILADDEQLEFEISRGQKKLALKITKNYGQPLGLKFYSSVFDSIKTCCNKCLFCFVDQLPPDVRPELHVKDDDYRLSFLYGNFITLTNLTENDISRIIDLRLSPLYVSLHSTEPKVRSKLFGNHSLRVLKILKKLLEHKIKIHIQIVLCPGINDDSHLWQTLDVLNNDFKEISSIGIVPVGLTRYGMSKGLRLFSAEEMKRVVLDIEKNKFKRYGDKQGKKIILADEFFLKGSLEIPDEDYYLDYSQLENGIGMTRKFLVNIKKNKTRLVLRQDIGIITAKLFYPVIKQVLEEITDGLERVNLYPVENNFFGPSVTVNGLLTGSDIIQYLIKKKIPDYLFMSQGLLASGKFLDNKKAEDIKNKLKCEVFFLDNYGVDFQKNINEVAG